MEIIGHQLPTKISIELKVNSNLPIRFEANPASNAHCSKPVTNLPRVGFKVGFRVPSMYIYLCRSLPDFGKFRL